MSDTDTIIIDYLFTKCAICRSYDPDKYFFQKTIKDDNARLKKILVCWKCSDDYFKSDLYKKNICR